MENTTTQPTQPKNTRFAPRAMNTQDTKFDDEASQQSQKAQPYQSSSRAQSGSAAPSTGSARGRGSKEMKDSKEMKSDKSEGGTDEASDLPGDRDLQGSDWASDISTQSKSFEKTFNQFVTKRPLAIMAGAIAVGFLANRYLAGRSSGAVDKMNKGV